MSGITLSSPAGRRLIAASILGSGAAFLEGSVVSVALPAMAREMGLGVEGLQWILNAYLITLSALMLLGGALGDRFGRRRIFTIGAVAFAVSSVGCALAPGFIWLLIIRSLQGGAGALLVPNSLALLEAEFTADARPTAIGRWAGWSGVSTAIGPLAGGALVDAASWRWVFAMIVPIALAAGWLAGFAPEGARAAATGKGASKATQQIDYLGAGLVTAALACGSAALIAGPGAGFRSPLIVAGIALSIALGIAFVYVERNAASPLVPPAILKVRDFVGANIATLLLYVALYGLLLFLVLQLQNNLAYSALRAGAALLPVNILLLMLSPTAGRLGHRLGAHRLMIAGSLVAAAGMMLLTRVVPGAPYATVVLPAIGVFGMGLAMLVSPLTSVVLGSVPDRDAGVASGFNNAVARLSGLLAAAVLPVAAGMGGLDTLSGPRLTSGFVRATWICAGLCASGAFVTFAMIGRSRVSAKGTRAHSPRRTESG